MTSSGAQHGGGQPGPARTPARRAVAILPARLASTRLPRKMLLDDTGAPLIVHSARNVLASGVFARVVVAADDARIVDAVRAHGLEAVPTRVDHPSGSDRVNECFAALRAAGESAHVIVNVQGDEPELPHEDLRALVAAFDDPRVEMATLAAPLPATPEGEALRASPSVVKVVCDAHGDALYFSRAPIPARGHARAADDRASIARRHVGVYAFSPAALARFCALPRGVLEAEESLEQLRWLEHGGKLRVVNATRAPQGIDTPQDYAAFVARAKSAPRDAVGGGRSESGAFHVRGTVAG